MWCVLVSRSPSPLSHSLFTSFSIFVIRYSNFKSNIHKVFAQREQRCKKIRACWFCWCCCLPIWKCDQVQWGKNCGKRTFMCKWQPRTQQHSRLMIVWRIEKWGVSVLSVWGENVMLFKLWKAIYSSDHNKWISASLFSCSNIVAPASGLDVFSFYYFEKLPLILFLSLSPSLSKPRTDIASISILFKGLIFLLLL